jgi:hypothetical protein
MVTPSLSTRRVRQVHLQAPTTDLIWRGRLLLEDAFHTATLLQAESAQLWLIRQLNLGPIHSHQSAATLALTLEQKVAQLSAIALHGSHPEAPSHSVVYFHDTLDACLTLAHRLARHQPCQAWFWPLVLPHWQPHSSAHDTFLAMLTHLAQTPPAALAIATLLTTLHQHHSLTPLLTLLTVEDGHALLALLGWTVPQGSPSNPSFPPSSLPIYPLPWPHTDPRSLWLTTLMLLDQHPTWINDPQLIVRSQTLLSQLSPALLSPLMPAAHPPVPAPPQNADVPTLDPNSPPPDLPVAASSTEVTQAGAPSASDVPSATEGNQSRLNQLNLSLLNQPRPQPPTANKAAAPIKPGILAGPSPSVAVLAPASSLLNPAAPPGSVPGPWPLSSYALAATDYGGLLFLLPLLDYLGLPRRTALVTAEFPLHLLRYLTVRLALNPEDPILVALPPSDQPTPEAGLLQAWYSALRQGSRRIAQMTLLELIGRPAQLTATRTHLDLFFDLNQTDIRIRKAGLDLNPGWLPWFGRVIQFHYRSSQE